MTNAAPSRKLKARDYKINARPLPVPEGSKFKLAVGLVAGILVMLFMSAFAEIFGQQAGDTVFKSALVVLPPILTLIIGYYLIWRNPAISRHSLVHVYTRDRFLKDISEIRSSALEFLELASSENDRSSRFTKADKSSILGNESGNHTRPFNCGKGL